MTERSRGRVDLEVLLNWLIPVAQQQLADHGDFAPFGYAITSDGDVEGYAGFSDAPEELRPPQEWLDMMIETMQQHANAGKIRAAGVCFGARIDGDDGKPTDAIGIDFEHLDGDAKRIFLPYSKRSFRGFRFGELLGNEGRLHIFRRVPSGDLRVP